jgi:hypothetical protein
MRDESSSRSSNGIIVLELVLRLRHGFGGHVVVVLVLEGIGKLLEAGESWPILYSPSVLESIRPVTPFEHEHEHD